MKAKSAKAKGTRLEKFVASELRRAGFKSAKRMPMSGAIPGFKSDIFCLELPLIMELKNQESWSPLKYMEQASRDADITGKMPVVIMSKNRLPEPMVMMKFGDWVQILQRGFIENKMPIMVGINSYSKRKQLKKG